MSALLTIRDLGLVAGGQKILEGFELDLARGEVVGLVGESGAGKSSAGLAAMGYVRDGVHFACGSVRFDGTELVGLSRSRLSDIHGRRIAYVAQSAAASFNPAHKLIDQYAEGPVRHGVADRDAARADAVTLYRQMRLPEPDQIGFRYPHQVSGGQLQRAMTAMAMACRPDVIIFDEPTTALDVTTQIEVLGAIRDVVDRHGTAALYISHDLAVVAQMADRIRVMKDGRTVETAPTARMLDAPEAEYTRALWNVRNTRRPEAPPATGALIEIEGLTASYGEAAVLHDVDVALAEGRTTALVGESGSGKSTLARVLAGLLPPDEGRVTWRDRPMEMRLRRRDRDTLRHVQMIYQSADTALNPRQSVGEILRRPVRRFTGRTGRALGQRVEELMAQVDLDPGLLKRRPGDLSGGQKQRVGIARALAAEPDLILCDEVTSALDPLVADSILRLLVDLQSRLDLTLLFITHDLATVEAIAHDVVVMKDGRIVERGTRDALFAEPQADYTRRLLASVPQMDPGWLARVRDLNSEGGPRMSGEASREP